MACVGVHRKQTVLVVSNDTRHRAASGRSEGSGRSSLAGAGGEASQPVACSCWGLGARFPALSGSVFIAAISALSLPGPCGNNEVG